MLAQSLDLELNTLYVVCSNFVSTIYVYTSATYQVKINKSTMQLEDDEKECISRIGDESFVLFSVALICLCLFHLD